MGAHRTGRLLALDRRAREMFLMMALPPSNLRRVCRKLGLSFPGYRLEAIRADELAHALAEEYEGDARAPEITDRVIEEECGLPLSLPHDLLRPRVVELLVELAGAPPSAVVSVLWSLFGHRTMGVRAAAAGAMEKYLDRTLADLACDARDDVDGESGGGRKPAPSAPELRHRLKESEMRVRVLESEVEASRDLIGRERRLAAEKDARIVQLKADLESIAGRARRLEEEMKARDDLLDRDLLQEARREAAEARRLARELEETQAKLLESRRAEAELATRLRAREEAGASGPATLPPAAAPAPPATTAGPFMVPVFTSEFYDSLRRWDVRTIRAAFEKVLLLCQNLAHPGIDAKAIQGVQGLYRIFVGQDVRLFYRTPRDGRIELLSLVDREDLDRYVRQFKSRIGV